MHLLKLGDQIAKAIMLKLAQQRVRNVGRYVAAAGALADLGGKSLGNGGGQLLSPGRFTHAVILPMVGSGSPTKSWDRLGSAANPTGKTSGQCHRRA